MSPWWLLLIVPASMCAGAYLFVVILTYGMDD